MNGSKAFLYTRYIFVVVQEPRGVIRSGKYTCDNHQRVNFALSIIGNGQTYDANSSAVSEKRPTFTPVWKTWQIFLNLKFRRVQKDQ